ncbi:ATP-binding protein [Streptomyces aculeolatus]|uniref:ATP-binding protein n=1 Tax=Streptomyces aculeolatus TaxID=270689 RepID=UPI0027E21029|nr:ATP-binding protein [Streptomyces aculeolatus]
MVMFVVAQQAPASSMAVPHGPDGVGLARRRLRADLRARGTAETTVDDAVLVLSELLSNACRHARPLATAAATADAEVLVPARPDARPAAGPGPDRAPGTEAAPAAAPGREEAPAAAGPGTGDTRVRADWHVDPDGRVTVAVTDGGGPTRPLPATPSVTAKGGRGLAIISSLACDWGVRYDAGPLGEVTVWASLPGH